MKNKFYRNKKLSFTESMIDGACLILDGLVMILSLGLVGSYFIADRSLNRLRRISKQRFDNRLSKNKDIRINLN